MNDDNLLGSLSARSQALRYGQSVHARKFDFKQCYIAVGRFLKCFVSIGGFHDFATEEREVFREHGTPVLAHIRNQDGRFRAREVGQRRLVTASPSPTSQAPAVVLPPSPVRLSHGSHRVWKW